MSIDRDLFRSVLGRFATGITIITIRDADGHDHGMTVSAFSSLSLDPPMVLVCIANDATMAPALATVDAFAVNILADHQEALSRRFSGKQDDRFADVPFSRTAQGTAVLDEVLASLDCRILTRHSGGDHVIVIGEVLSGQVREGRPLLYYRGGYAQLER